MVGAVELREALEVIRCPGVLSLQEFVDFALGAGTLAYGPSVILSCFLQGRSRSLDLDLWLDSVLYLRKSGLAANCSTLLLDVLLQSLDARVTGQIVESLTSNEDVGLQIVHHVREPLR